MDYCTACDAELHFYSCYTPSSTVNILFLKLINSFCPSSVESLPFNPAGPEILVYILGLGAYLAEHIRSIAQSLYVS